MKKINAVVVSFLGLMLPSLVLAQWIPENLGASNLPSGSVEEIVFSVMQWILTLFGFIAIIGFVISGILYLTAAGNEDQAKTAKRAMFYSIIGVIVALAGLVIILEIDSLLSGGGWFFF